MILEANSVVKNFGGLTAVNRVSLQVAEGEVIGLIGPNGAGKTTFLNCLAGTLKPSAGTVHFRGEDTTGATADVMCRKGMSRTFQIPLPFPKLTVLENVMVGAQFGGGTTRPDRPARQRAEEALDFVQFPLPHDTQARCCNAVQLKRLDLARAWACGPKLMLLDELASGLTPTELDEMIALDQADPRSWGHDHRRRTHHARHHGHLRPHPGHPVRLADRRGHAQRTCCAIPRSSKPISATRRLHHNRVRLRSDGRLPAWEARLLEIKNIDAGYDFLQVLWDVSLSADEGEFVALIGPNGAGKTTTLRTTAGLVKPIMGQVTFQRASPSTA